MHRILDLIENLGGGFNHISLQVGKLCKMVSKKVKESLTLILTHSTGDDLIDYKIYGNSTQDGTPTPETPKDVVSLGEDGEVNVITSGKNLFDIDKLWSDGTQILRSPEQARALTIPVPNGTYTISTNCPNNTTPTVATILVGNGQNSLDAFTSSANGVLLNIPKTIVVDTGYLEIGIRNVSPNYLIYDEASWNSSGNWIQAEEGTEATDYEPYQGEPVTTVIDLTGHEPLRKLDDLSDYIDYENGKIIRNIGKLVLDGTNSIPIQENPFFVDAKGYRLTISNYASSNKKPMSNYFVGVSNNKNLTDNCIVGASYVNIVMSYAENINTVAEFKSWLASKYAEGNPVIVYYALNTPVEEDITLPTIPTVEGTTVLEVANIPTASNMYAKYYGTE